MLITLTFTSRFKSVSKRPPGQRKLVDCMVWLKITELARVKLVFLTIADCEYTIRFEQEPTAHACKNLQDSTVTFPATSRLMMLAD